MLGRRKKKQTTAQTELLTAVYHARDQWHYAAQIETLAVEVDEEMQLALKFGVESIPMLAVIKDGKLVNKSVGFKPKEQILELL